jgi:hypothetical protein
MKFTTLTLSALVALLSVSATPAPIGERSIEERQWNVSEYIGVSIAYEVVLMAQLPVALIKSFRSKSVDTSVSDFPSGWLRVALIKLVEYRDGARDYCNGMLGQRCNKVCHDGGNIHD